MQVASRSVFVVCGILYMVLGVLGKLSALIISIPYPVLGGSLITMMGMFVGVTLSNLRSVSLTSTRNLAVIGMSIMVGLIIPQYVKRFGSDIDTGKFLTLRELGFNSRRRTIHVFEGTR